MSSRSRARARFSKRRELHVAASAIDRHILLLERDFNMELFERLPRGMRPTAAGDVIIALARNSPADERRAAADLRQLQGVDQGHTWLVVMDSHVNGFLPRVIRGLNAGHPAISPDVEVNSSRSKANISPSPRSSTRHPS